MVFDVEKDGEGNIGNPKRFFEKLHFTKFDNLVSRLICSMF